MNGNPVSYLFPLVALMSIIASRSLTGRGKEMGAFLASAAFLALMLVSVVFGLYPMVLPAAGDAASSLTIHNASGPPYAMRVALAWWVPGMMLVSVYTTYMYRQMRGKVKLDPDAY
jgi:cytochrome d ubiquinol oxidase subunit II